MHQILSVPNSSDIFFINILQIMDFQSDTADTEWALSSIKFLRILRVGINNITKDEGRECIVSYVQGYITYLHMTSIWICNSERQVHRRPAVAFLLQPKQHLTYAVFDPTRSQIKNSPCDFNMQFSTIGSPCSCFSPAIQSSSDLCRFCSLVEG